jgi:hypothetical protein
VLVCILAPVACYFLARAILVAPHVALLIPAIGAVGGVAALASALPG